MSNLIGLGNDIIEVDRIRDSLKEYGDRFLERLFTKKERDYCMNHKDPAIRVAGRFAAKEAIAKALGTGFGSHLTWHDIEILNDELGKPQVTLKNHPGTHIHLSISHCQTYATAVALASKA